MVLSRFQHSSTGSLRILAPAEEAPAANLESQDLLSQANAQRQSGHLPEAMGLYSQIAAETEGPLQHRAQEQLNAIQGTGGFTAARAEFLAETFVDQVMDPAALGAMLGAGLTYRAARFGLLGTASRLGMRSRLVRPTASLLAFGGEASLFPIYGRLGNIALGRGADWSSGQLLHDIQGSFLVLGGLKLFGAAGNHSLRSWMQSGRAGGSLAQRLLPTLVPQTAMYLGILSGHQAEAWMGLREATSTGQLLSESLVTLFHFNAMGRLLPLMAGSRLRAFEQDLENQSQRLLPQALGSPGLTLAEATAASGGHRVRRTAAAHPKTNHIVLMANHGESNGNGSNGRELVNGRRGSRESKRRAQAQLRSYSSQIERVLGTAMDVYINMEGQLEPQASRDLEAGIIELIERQAYWQREISEVNNLPRASQGRQRERIALGLLELRQQMERFVRSGSPEVLGESPLERQGQEYQLRQYQQEMMETLNRDLANEELPWLGLASPMQTGKSFLIGPIVRRLQRTFGSQTRVIILSSARVITDQIIGDLLEGFPAQELGRFDSQQKDIRNITVASVPAMVRNLDRFDTDSFTVVINDEAFFTQSPSFGSIYEHFGLAEAVRNGRRVHWEPRQANGRVIGLSGTGGGLEGHHISGELPLLSAIERGWVRHMEGDRVFLEIQSQNKQGTGGEKMIWWRPNEANADALAQVYGERIREDFDSSLVFVPTIRHGELLLAAMRRRFGFSHARLVHSKMSENDVERNIQAFERSGGALISVKKLSRGFRGTGVESVFHTYQTSSAELFAQRTGRAWGNSLEEPLQDLYVLETAWSGQENFANLARVLGLVDYPRRRFNTRGLQDQVETQRQKRELAEERDRVIQRGEASDIFRNVPLVASWRNRIRDLLAQAGGVASLSGQTGLAQNHLAGYALGGLATRWADVQPMSEVLGGEAQARDIWVSTWREVVNEYLQGTEPLADALGRDLSEWNDRADPLEVQARSLDEILARHFPRDEVAESSRHTSKRYLFGLDYFRYQFQDQYSPELIERVVLDLGEELRMRWVNHPYDLNFGSVNRNQLDAINNGITTHILDHRVLSNETTYTAIAEVFGVEAKWVGSVSTQIYLNINERFPIRAEAYFAMEELGLSPSVEQALARSGIYTIDRLAESSQVELEAIPGMDAPAIAEIRQALQRQNLSLAPFSPTIPWHEFITEDLPFNINLTRKVGDLELSARSANALNYRLDYIWELVRIDPNDFIKIKNIGKRSLEEITEILADMGLQLGMSVDLLDRPIDDIGLTEGQLGLLKGNRFKRVGELFDFNWHSDLPKIEIGGANYEDAVAIRERIRELFHDQPGGRVY